MLVIRPSWFIETRRILPRRKRVILPTDSSLPFLRTQSLPMPYENSPYAEGVA